jgi:hypothetical protein
MLRSVQSMGNMASASPGSTLSDEEFAMRRYPGGGPNVARPLQAKPSTLRGFGHKVLGFWERRR